MKKAKSQKMFKCKLKQLLNIFYPSKFWGIFKDPVATIQVNKHAEWSFS